MLSLKDLPAGWSAIAMALSLLVVGYPIIMRGGFSASAYRTDLFQILVEKGRILRMRP
jgi:hypothetical protein